LREFVYVVVFVLLTAAVAGCSSAQDEASKEAGEPKIGTIEGVQVSFSLDDASDGQIDQIDFWGVVTVALEDDGRRVDATVTNELAAELRGGDRVEVVALEGSEYWEVIGLASDE